MGSNALSVQEKNVKLKLSIFGGVVLTSMLAVTFWASYKESIFEGGPKLVHQPWGIATLVDTYLAFTTFYLWVYYKERSIAARIVWLVLIYGLGNIAMAAYLLIQIKKSKSDTIEGIFLRE